MYRTEREHICGQCHRAAGRVVQTVVQTVQAVEGLRGCFQCYVNLGAFLGAGPSPDWPGKHGKGQSQRQRWRMIHRMN
jgi:hypothetical protein